MELFFDFTLFQERHGQLVLFFDKHLQGSGRYSVKLADCCHAHTENVFICTFSCMFQSSSHVGLGRRPETKWGEPKMSMVV